MNNIKYTFGFLLSLLFYANNSYSTTHIVNSVALFNTAQSNAQPGDTIQWSSGTFSNINLTVSKGDIVIISMEPGKTIFNGSSKLKVTADNIEFSGFQYVGGNIGTGYVIDITGSNNIFSELNIKDYFCNKYFVIRSEGKCNEVLYCNFENKLPFDRDQNVLSILVDATNPGYNKIRYCSFKNFVGAGGDMGVEPIRIGLSSQGNFISRTLVEYCYFARCDGDGEIISHKSRQNVYRYNTFDDNPKAEFVLRHGSESLVYGNFFLNGMGGIRVKEGQNHYIFNNYFQNLTDRTIWLMNNSADPLDSILIAYNTMVDCKYLRLGAPGDNPPEHVFIANNIFSDPKSNLFLNATGRETWVGNIAHGSLGITTPGSGLSPLDPNLIANTDGFYNIESNSPAIDGSQTGYPAIPEFPEMDLDNDVELDIMQQTRPANIAEKDVGCSEYAENTVITPHVNETNTGPHYLQNMATDLGSIINNQQAYLKVFPNPFTDIITIEFDVGSQRKVELSVFNSCGKKIKTVKNNTFKKGINNVQVDLSTLESGFYVVCMKTENGILFNKVVKR